MISRLHFRLSEDDIDNLRSGEVIIIETDTYDEILIEGPTNLFDRNPYRT